MDFSPVMASEPVYTLLILFGIAILAGWVDAIAGGGGLISIPSLIWAGLSPIQALATNKLQACFGSFTATWNYHRKGLVNIKEHQISVVLTFAGASLGAWLVQSLDSTLLAKMIPILLIGFALYFLFQPNIDDVERQQRLSLPIFAVLIGFGVGFYDGFFGPGTGTFFVIAFVALLAYPLARATGNTKLLNFVSNFAALIIFSFSGQVIWHIGLIMGVGQLLGSFVGSSMAIRQGQRLIRPLLVVVSLLVSLHLLLGEARSLSLD